MTEPKIPLHTGILDVIERAGPGAYYIFDCLSDLAASDFVPTMRALCRTLPRAYECPVDIEFTANFSSTTPTGTCYRAETAPAVRDNP